MDNDDPNALIFGELSEGESERPTETRATTIFKVSPADIPTEVRLVAELERVLDALEDMVAQYCRVNGKLHHQFMSAGEEAFAVLEDAGRLRHVGNEVYEIVGLEEEEASG